MLKLLEKEEVEHYRIFDGMFDLNFKKRISKILIIGRLYELSEENIEWYQSGVNQKRPMTEKRVLNKKWPDKDRLSKKAHTRQSKLTRDS